ncbi:MAG TPA: right-handed parallel beta-helix repeat-containing protein [Candidatus Saccharimonadales bacterium]|nr:right-handed parallel beta-helix repeat-containing protein [Candidatus Saccharimonadales bacterium]
MTAAQVRPFWIAFFGMVVASQLGHTAEHVAQIIQIHGFGMRAPDARGMLSALDTEWVHFVWNGWILVAVAALLVAHPRNRWLWLAAALSTWHAFEHAYLLSGYLVTGISGQPGFLASGGLIGGGLPVARPDLHFAYNLAELVPLALAFRAALLGQTEAAAAVRSPARTDGRRALGAAALALAAVLVTTGGSALSRTVPVATIDVAAGTALQAAIDAAPSGALIRIGSGTFSGPLVVSRPLSLVGMADGSTRLTAAPAATVISVLGTRDVTLAQLVVIGGEYGVLVEESRAVRVLGSWIRDATFVGIRISRSAALLQGNEVRAGSGPYGMGIELANTMSQAHSFIRGNVVSGSTKEGIVLHNAEAMIERNIVRGNGFRGIAINEMSMAMIIGNTLRDNGDAGIAVVDHSMAEIDGNDIQGVFPGADGTAIGIRSFYYAEVSLGRNRIAVGDPTLAAAGGTFEAHTGR